MGDCQFVMYEFDLAVASGKAGFGSCVIQQGATLHLLILLVVVLPLYLPVYTHTATTSKPPIMSKKSGRARGGVDDALSAGATERVLKQITELYENGLTSSAGSMGLKVGVHTARAWSGSWSHRLGFLRVCVCITCVEAGYVIPVWITTPAYLHCWGGLKGCG